MSAPAKKSYYGAFFWLSVVSFLVPLVVALKAFDAAKPTTKPVPNPDVSGVDHALWDYLLKSYVEGGLIDYDGMARDHLFRTYLRQIGTARPDDLPTPEDRLAFYCNAYNALVVNGVITHRIKDSVMNYQHYGLGFFDVKEHLVAGATMSLNDLEHKLIRPTFKEPRVHVALVCAARGCPPIRPEAYTGSNLDAQLRDQSILFSNSPKYVAYDLLPDTLTLSPILKWYAEDWKEFGGVFSWLADRAEDPAVQAALRRKVQDPTGLVYAEYDWSLNSRQTPGSAGGSSPKASFGSGTIPND
jgi:hypothetical protein